MSATSFDALRARYAELVARSWAGGCAAELAAGVAGGGAPHRAAADQALRDALLPLVRARHLRRLQRYVAYAVAAARAQAASPTLPVVLLGDIFDGLTLHLCEHMFAYVEDGVAVWKEELFFVACKNNLLRMCNDLLRRLSRSQNTIFCGRILLFLAKFFPFSERSGLNIVSEFNLDNVTELGGDGDFKDAVEEEEPAEDSKKSAITIDYNLYCKFWALQDYFRNPNLCYNKVQWKTFSLHSSCVLSAFSSYKLESVQLKDAVRKRRPSLSMDVDAAEDKEERENHYFAKFLTNQKLLELQLSDSNFRRCILVQFLILFQYLQSSVKFKTEAFELKADQTDWAKETTDLVYKLIAETPPDGANFAKSVKQILKREELWNNWKNDGCPEFQKLKAALPVEQTGSEETKKYLRPRRKRLLGDIVKDYESQGKFYMGNGEITKLWNLCPNNLEACKGKERDFLPSLETYLAEAIDQADKGVQGNERVVADENFGWRALRLLASRSPHFFTYSNSLINKLPDYLETMIKKIGKDLAASKQADLDPGEGEISEEQMEADLMKDGEQNYSEQNQDAEPVGENRDYEDEKPYSSPKTLTDDQMSILCEKLSDDWKRLATKIGFKEDEILFFIENNETNPLRASKMLEIYFQDDEDASIDNLIYILEGLEMMDAAAVLKDI